MEYRLRQIAQYGSRFAQCLVGTGMFHYRTGQHKDLPQLGCGPGFGDPGQCNGGHGVLVGYWRGAASTQPRRSDTMDR